MLLEAVELHLRSPKTEDLSFRKKLQIEHLMPREWREHWPLPHSSIAAIEGRNAVLQTIGNLTLLTEALNPSVSNGPWKVKCKAILEHSALSLNRRLAEVADWNENSIRQRSIALLEAVEQIWPHPGRAVDQVDF